MPYVRIAGHRDEEAESCVTQLRYRLTRPLSKSRAYGGMPVRPRFAYNQCLQMVNSAIKAGRVDDRRPACRGQVLTS